MIRSKEISIKVSVRKSFPESYKNHEIQLKARLQEFINLEPCHVSFTEVSNFNLVDFCEQWKRDRRAICTKLVSKEKTDLS